MIPHAMPPSQRHEKLQLRLFTSFYESQVHKLDNILASTSHLLSYVSVIIAMDQDTLSELFTANLWETAAIGTRTQKCRDFPWRKGKAG